MASKTADATDPLDELWPEIEHAARFDDGAAARGHLEAGRAIYYREAYTAPGTVIKEYPSGKQEIVRIDPDGEHSAQAAE